MGRDKASVRENKKGRTLFLLNHTADSKQIVLDQDYVDLVSKNEYKAGDKLEVNGKGAVILHTR